MIDGLEPILFGELLEIYIHEEALRNQACQLTQRQVLLQVVALAYAPLAPRRLIVTHHALAVVALRDEVQTFEVTITVSVFDLGRGCR